MPIDFASRFEEVICINSSQCDLTDLNMLTLHSLNWRENAVILFLAVVNKSAENSSRSYTKNLKMAENVAITAKKIGAAGLIFTSSVDVYGNKPPIPIYESTPVRPDSWYAQSKLSSEKKMAAILHGHVPLGIFRCPGIFNLSPHDYSVVARLTKSVKTDRILTLNNRGVNTRDFICSDDLYILFAQWCHSPKTGLWNAVSGMAFSMRDVAMHIISTVGYGGIQMETTRGRDFDLDFNADALTRDFGSNPLRPFAEAFSRCFAHQRKAKE